MLAMSGSKHEVGSCRTIVGICISPEFSPIDVQPGLRKGMTSNKQGVEREHLTVAGQWAVSTRSALVQAGETVPELRGGS
jgi:hypothetical protein